MGIGFGIVFLAPTVLEILSFSFGKKRSRQQFPSHVTTGSSIQCVHWIERGQFSGYRFWNRVSSPYRSRDIDVLVFKGEFALEARFLREKGVEIFFSKI